MDGPLFDPPCPDAPIEALKHGMHMDSKPGNRYYLHRTSCQCWGNETVNGRENSVAPSGDGARGTAQAQTADLELTFGECEGLCGGMVERVGWDRFCFSCQEEMRREDEERDQRMDEEDDYLYGGRRP